MVELWLEVNGVRYTGFTSASVVKNLDQLSGAFNFAATAEEGSQFPIANGSECRVMIGDTPIITGYIEVVEGSSATGSHLLTLRGRDKLADVIDSSLPAGVELNANISLESVIRTILDSLGLTTIEIINNAGSLKKFTKSELVSGEVGESAFETIEKYCRKRQVLCTSDGNSNIVLTRASTNKIPTLLLRQLNGQRNNILTSSYNSDNSKRFNTYEVRSQSNLSVLIPSTSKLASTSGIVTDSEIRSTRKLTIVSESSMNDDDCLQRAIWEKNVRKARAFGYSCTLQGYVYNINDDVWTVNNIVHVVDDLWNVNADLLINSITYSLSLEGSFTTLGLVDKNSYTLQASIDEFDERVNKKGGVLAGLGL